MLVPQQEDSRKILDCSNKRFSDQFQFAAEWWNARSMSTVVTAAPGRHRRAINPQKAASSAEGKVPLKLNQRSH